MLVCRGGVGQSSWLGLAGGSKIVVAGGYEHKPSVVFWVPCVQLRCKTLHLAPMDLLVPCHPS